VGRRRLAFAAAAVLAGVLSVSASASDSQGRPLGSPDLAAMSLQLSDFPTGARVAGQRYVRDPDFVATYEREFSLGGRRVGRSTLALAFTELNVAPDASRAGRLHAAVARAMKRKSFRTEFGRLVARAAGMRAGSVAVGQPRTPKIGNGAVTFPLRVRQQGVVVQMGVALLRVDRVLGSVLLLAAPGKRVFNADVDRLARASAERMRAGLVPAASGEPAVTGTTTSGRTLSAGEGVWTGDQLEFTYQWERCTGDAETACAPIPGATADTHTLTKGDLASRLRVTVTGRNRLGSLTATSPMTAVVTGPPGSPVVTEAPVVEGLVGPGATLTSTTGTWTGTPASFSFQWRRCNATTGACVDIAEAEAEIYTLTTADSGSVLRVLVVAENAAGPGGALTAPSTPIP
jgi:hypothetical protein